MPSDMARGRTHADVHKMRESGDLSVSAFLPMDTHSVLSEHFVVTQQSLLAVPQKLLAFCAAANSICSMQSKSCGSMPSGMSSRRPHLGLNAVRYAKLTSPLHCNSRKQIACSHEAVSACYQCHTESIHPGRLTKQPKRSWCSTPWAASRSARRSPGPCRQAVHAHQNKQLQLGHACPEIVPYPCQPHAPKAQRTC
jgi:hypothetical protein